MEKRSKHMLIFTSSHKTPRIYLNLLKDYLQKQMPDAVIDYFISQHDNENINLQHSSVIESRQIEKSTDILIGLDGELPRDMLKEIKAKKVLIYLPEIGKPHNKKRYFSGYDYIVSFDEEYDSMFRPFAKRGNITILDGVRDIFKSEIQNAKNVEFAKNNLYRQYPQIIGKKIVSIVSRGICDSKYLERYKKIDIRGLLKGLPDDVVLMTNCRQIQLAGASLPYKYINKFVAFGQNNLLDVLAASKWIFSNMGISQKTGAKQGILLYNGNDFEKYSTSKKTVYCLEPDEDFVKNILAFLKKSNVTENRDYIRGCEFSDILSRL